MNTKVKTETIVRTVVTLIALLNQILITFNMTPFDLDESLLYTLVSSVLTFASTVWVWWQNNSFTPEAIAADEFLEKAILKKESKFKNNIG